MVWLSTMTTTHTAARGSNRLSPTALSLMELWNVAPSNGSTQPGSPAIPKSICLPGWEDGHTHCALPDGQMTGLSGRDHALVNPSPSLDAAKDGVINGIYGQTCIDSFVSDGPLASWENRLRERLGTIGSTEYGLTWRKKITKRGRWISRLAGLVRRTSGKDCTGWPTPDAQVFQDGETPKTWLARRERLKKLKKNGNGMGTPLAMAVQLAGLRGWRSPQAHDAKKPDPTRYNRSWKNLNDEAAMVLTGWATSTKRDHKDASSTLENTPVNYLLGRQVLMVAGWSTPRSTDGAKGDPNMKFGAGGSPLPTQAAHMPDSGMITSSSDPIQTACTGALNPAFVSWLMGYPIEYLNWGP